MLHFIMKKKNDLFCDGISCCKNIDLNMDSVSWYDLDA